MARRLPCISENKDMSRRKSPIAENSVGGRLRIFRESKSVGIVEFAKLLGISNGTLSDIENNKTTPSGKPVGNLVRNTDINIYWLFTGSGNPYRTKRSENGDIDTTKLSFDDDPNIALLLELTKKVLKSKTNFSESLAANIRSFHDAVEKEEETEGIKQQLEDLKRRIDKISGDCSNNKCPSCAAENALKKKAT